MKKVMFAAAAAASMLALGAGVESGVVGYKTGTTGSDNNFITIPFSDVGYNTVDIQAIKISDGGAGAIGWGGENFSIWEGVPSVAEGSSFFYYDSSMDLSGEATAYYWGDSDFNKASYSIAPGQAVVINCVADLEVMTSGEVSDEQIAFTSVQDNNFTGNPFPSAIDIQAIKISDGDAGTIGWGGENFSIWEGVPSVTEGSSFFYYDSSMDLSGEATAYYWGDSNFNKATYSIAPGQGAVINCAEGLSITIDAPFSLEN